LPQPSFFGADRFSGYLPIIYNIRKVKITDSYHKFLGLTTIGGYYGEIFNSRGNGATTICGVYQQEDTAISDPALLLDHSIQI
jgi:hypothetical protein